MYFTNDKQARAFLDSYREWNSGNEDFFMNRRWFDTIFCGARIIVEETEYLTFFYDGTFHNTERSEYGHPEYYILPEGSKSLKPMSAFRVKISEAVRLLRQIDKDYTDGSD